LPEVLLDNNQQEDTVETQRRTNRKMHGLYFFEVLPYCSATSSCHPGGLARTLPLSTRHHVTLAFVMPSCLPWLVVASALVVPFSLHRCLSMRSLRLLPPICLLFSLAGCCVTSHCAASASHCLSSHRRLSSTRRLVVVLPLIVPPPPRVSSPHRCLSSCRLCNM
jgi:hypothetical protein